MKESAQTAHSYVWCRAEQLGIDRAKVGDQQVHIHVPAGAIPKDGPSAGVAMATAIASLYTGRLARSDTAMTGEISLSGLVLPVGGIKDKLLAARRSGIRRVILPRANEPQLQEIPGDVRADLDIVFATRVEDVIEAGLSGRPRDSTPPPRKKPCPPARITPSWSPAGNAP
jgi:ATP-dependent Lon protease